MSDLVERLLDLYEPSVAELMVEAAAEFERLRADALRYQYIRDNLSKVSSLKMDGQHSYRFSPLYRYRGPTLDAALDKAIEALGETDDE